MSCSNIKIIITVKDVDEANKKVLSTPNYGKEDILITDCLKRFPRNTDRAIVALKVALIDITNNTRLGLHKRDLSLCDIVDKILSIKDFDERVKNGDPEIVNEIAKANGKVNLFSFASKYCCYHNKNLYGNDDYSIYDTILKNNLSKYFNDITKSQIEKWRKNFDYKSYNDYIGNKLDELGIHCAFRRRKFDHFIWYNNR